MTYQDYANTFYDYVFGRGGFLFSCHPSWSAAFVGAMSICRGFRKEINLRWH